jgi:hypothetical protein
VNLACHKAQAVTLEHGFRLIAPVGEKSGWSGCDRTLAHGRGFGQHTLRVELLTPAGHVADPPTHG